MSKFMFLSANTPAFVAAIGVAVAVLALAAPVNARGESIAIDADFPGGNILVTGIDGDIVSIKQDLRDTTEWWFYYCFRVRGAAGRTLTFKWMNQDPMAALGPAVSLDDGVTWAWLGRQPELKNSFRYAFPDDADAVRFCLAMPYQLANLEQFMAKHKDAEHFRAAVHAATPKRRTVYRWHAGRLDGELKHRVLVTSRHHACEMMASFTVEGIIDSVLSDTEEGRWLRENVELVAVPMMDVDGVEDGDQGKLRRPHDHNRDYEGEPIYASVAANKEFVPKWSQGKLRIALDLHCPWVRGGGSSRGSNEQLYFVGSPRNVHWDETTKLSMMLEQVQLGPLPYSIKHNLPFGESWNTTAPEKNFTFSRWAGTLPGVQVSSSIEIPYATAGGKPVTRASAHAFGVDLARAVARYLQELDK